jgi:DnaJ-class molecular chaperone
VSISSIEAILGVEAILDHLDGAKLQFTIPAGIQPGQIVKLAGKGMRNPEIDRDGDVLVRISINIPRNISDDEKNILKSLSHRESINI